MVLVHALVPEHFSQLIDLIESPDYQPFKVQLGGDAEVEVLVQGVVVGNEGSCVGTCSHRDQDRSLNFNKTFVVEELAYAGDDLATLKEDGLHIRVGDQVHVTLTVPLFDVPQTVPFFWKGPQRLGQDGKVLDFDRHFPGTCTEQRSADSKKVSQVQVLGNLETVSQNVESKMGLDATRTVFQVQERGLPHYPG